jgi:hypothetical protein
MSLKPLPGFNPFPTHHCVTGSMRHMYEFHDYPISEELLLGVGAGVGFIYWHMKGMPPMLGGRANFERPGEEGLEKTVGHRTGVRVESLHTTSARKAETSLLAMLDAGEPVMVQLDMGFLPYFDLPEDFHFGGHVVVICGCDTDAREVLVADRDEQLHPVSLEQLAEARGSTFKPFPPRNTWHTFDFARKRPPQPDEVRQAIAEVATGMLEPPITNIGVKGIRKAAQQTLKWPQSMNEKQLREACFNVFIFIDATGGTGGGIFRYMYGRFLSEAAQITSDQRLSEAGEEMHAIGDRWQAVAQTFRDAGRARDPAALLPDAATPLLDIADQEQAVWQRLREVVGRLESR